MIGIIYAAGMVTVAIWIAYEEREFRHHEVETYLACICIGALCWPCVLLFRIFRLFALAALIIKQRIIDIKNGGRAKTSTLETGGNEWQHTPQK